MAERKQRGKRSNSEVSSSSSSSTSSFSSDDETDARDLKPIRGYLSNRRELARQLFKSVKTEKIRMMLPQILKNMNLNDLEEWCASELSGMSEARILCILNGQPMLYSSDTSDTDDSGPSLEIISDTEEWLTDTDAPIKEEPSSSGAPKPKRVKVNKAKGKARKTEQDKSRSKAKPQSTIASGSTIDSDVTVKKEKDNRGSTNKEGESLLDLLELEMRARAIRALIRKEEDVIPSAATEKRMALTANALRNTLNSAVSASLSNEKSLNGKFNLGGSGESSNDKECVDKEGRNANLIEPGEDEDVVFVVAQPTPTIELLSSDNENDNGDEKNCNKDNTNENKTDGNIEVSTKSSRQMRNKNDNPPETTSNRDLPLTSERIVTIDKSGGGPDNFKIVITKRVSESSNSPSPTKSNKSKNVSTEKGDKNVPVSGANGNETSNEKIIVKTAQSGKGLFKKIKKKSHLRSKRKVTRDETNTERDLADETGYNELPSPIVEVSEVDSAKQNDEEPLELPSVTTVKLEKDSQEGSSQDTTKNMVEQEGKRKIHMPVRSDEDRLDDFEEIIDLDAYSEDMDEIENNDSVNSTNEDVNAKRNQQSDSPQKTPLEGLATKEASDSSETWASRYYQTDDVQNVIKESKIQSEIRKRLRERQRLLKLNSSPKPNSPGDAVIASDKPDEKNETKPTGSVQEYLALKSVSVSPIESNDVSNENLTSATESPETVVDFVLPTNTPIEDTQSEPLLPDSEKINDLYQ